MGIMTNNKKILTRAKELLETQGWIQGKFGSSDEGFCASGAITAAAHEIDAGMTSAMGVLAEAAGAPCKAGLKFCGCQIITWNDQDDRTEEEVLAAFDKAIGSEK